MKMDRALRSHLWLFPLPDGKLTAYAISADYKRFLSENVMVADLRNVPEQNLPVQLTSFVGREAEVGFACTLLRRADVRLLTLTGTGGIGKTRLGLQIVSRVRAEFAAGVYFISLASISDPELVIPAIAQTLGLQEVSTHSMAQRLHAYVQSRQMLLLIDNFEQVVVAARQLTELLAASSSLKIVVASRAVLHVRGEHEFPVAPLALPDPQQIDLRAESAQSAALTLFLERAQSVRPDFQLTMDNAQTLAALCVRLEGLPLAIELAAVRIKHLSPQALLTRLEDRFALLTNPAQDAPVRQKTLRATLAWSYDLLDPQEQQVFRRLSVFRGGFVLQAAETVCQIAGASESALLDIIASLLDKSLLSLTELRKQEPRFVMLETIREFGMACLLSQQEAMQTHALHATYYVTFAEEAEICLTTQEQRHWIERLTEEYDNLRAALAWLSAHKETEQVLRLSGALWRYWWICGQVSEGLSFLEPGLYASQVQPLKHTAIYAKALSAAGTLTGLQGNLDQAEERCSASLHFFRQGGDTRGCIISLWMLGYVAREKSAYTAAWSLAQESLALARQIDQPAGVTTSLEMLAAIAFDQGRYTEAHTLLKEGLIIAQRMGNIWEAARTLWLQAIVTLCMGNVLLAHSSFEESLSHFRTLNSKAGVANALVMLGYIAYFQGQHETMHALVKESLHLSQEIGGLRGISEALFALGWAMLGRSAARDAQVLFEESLAILRVNNRKWYLVLAMEGLAGSVALQGEYVWAARLWGAAELLREISGTIIPPIVMHQYVPLVASTRDRLGKAAFEEAWSAGRQLVIEATPAEALFSPPPASSTAVEKSRLAFPKQPLSSTYPAGLTAREVEILRYVSQGMTDIQVGEILIISPRTVSTHLTSIYNKLGVSSRAAATRFAIEQHLI